MNRIEYDTSQTGLEAVLRDWQVKLLKVVWASNQGLKSSQAHEKVKAALGSESISRASVINFLESMREAGVLRGVEETGKGGYHWVYYAAMDEAEFKRFVSSRLIESLMESFPSETQAALKKINH
jgi:Fe2+ or Zn2+ uptake regulation protein